MTQTFKSWRRGEMWRGLVGLKTTGATKFFRRGEGQQQLSQPGVPGGGGGGHGHGKPPPKGVPRGLQLVDSAAARMQAGVPSVPQIVERHFPPSTLFGGIGHATVGDHGIPHPILALASTPRPVVAADYAPVASPRVAYESPASGAILAQASTPPPPVAGDFAGPRGLSAAYEPPRSSAILARTETPLVGPFDGGAIPRRPPVGAVVDDAFPAVLTQISPSVARQIADAAIGFLRPLPAADAPNVALAAEVAPPTVAPDWPAHPWPATWRRRALDPGPSLLYFLSRFIPKLRSPTAAVGPDGATGAIGAGGQTGAVGPDSATTAGGATGGTSATGDSGERRAV